MRKTCCIIALALWLAALWVAGCVTPEERKAQADKEALCAGLDTNQDGRITKEEFIAQTSDKAKGLEVFEKCDKERKGYLTYDELWINRWMFCDILTPDGAPGKAGKVVPQNRGQRKPGSQAISVPSCRQTAAI